MKTLILSFAVVVLVEAGHFFTKVHFNPMLRLGVARLLELGLIVWIVHVVERSLCYWPSSNALDYRSKKGSSLVSGLRSAFWNCFSFCVHGWDQSAVHDSSRLPKNSANLLFFFLVGGIVAPVAEEVFFRGILYGFLRRWGIAVALVLSTSAFAITHGLGHGFPLTQVVGGILFAAAYEVEKNLLVPITIHCLGNMAIFALSALH